MAGPFNLPAGVNLDALSPTTRNMLNGISSRFNPGRAISITSGFRNTDDNKAAGGARGSQHIHGNAVDIDVSGWSDDEKRQFLDAAIDSGARGIGIYKSGNVMHIDTRANAATWGADPAAPYAGVPAEKQPAWAQASLQRLFAGGGGTVPPPPALATIRSTVTDAAKQFGVNENLMLWMAKRESNFNPNAKNASSSATGLFQFIDKTWADASRIYGPKLGMPVGTPATDPKWNAVMAAALMKENQLVMSKMLRREATEGELYLGHFLGGKKAVDMIAAAENTPDAPAAALFPGEAAVNGSIFFDKDGQPRSVASVYVDMTNIGKVGSGEGGEAVGDSKPRDQQTAQDDTSSIKVSPVKPVGPALQEQSKSNAKVESDIDAFAQRVGANRQARGLMG